MSHLAFVTTELAPSVPGGAGVLVAELRRILRERGHRVTVVLATGDLPPDDPLPDDVVVAVGDDTAGWDLSFMAVAKAAAEALSVVHAADPLDRIEIQDFDGLGFWALTHRGDLGIADVPTSVRFHGPVDLQTEAVGVSAPDLDAVAAMEREAYAMADRVVVPSAGIAALVIDRYGLAPDRVVVGAPPVRRHGPDVRWRPGGAELLVIGRLAEVKGSHDMVDAAIPVLADHADVSVAFVGDDGWSATERRPMREMLADRMPGALRDRFAFVDHLDAARLAERIAASMAVVVPSRFESFNLAVHEARRIGAPVIVPDLPAFDGVLDEGTGAMVYDGSVDGLRTTLASAVADRGGLAELASRPAPDPGDPLAPYEGAAADPRHRRSQGGLATAALARVEEVWLVPRRAGPPPSLGRRLLARVPDGVYVAVKRVVPNRIKDRLRDVTDWGAEADRRIWEERFQAAVERTRARGRDSEISVSVVVPCHNQGHFVREALLSVFEQTASGIETIIVDDGSDDGTTTPLLASLDLPRVRVIHQDNRGLPAARNAGIAASDAEYVVTLDADDLLAPRYVEDLMAAIAASPDAAHAHCWAELFGDTHMIWATRPYNPYQLLLSNSVVGCVLLRKSAWGAVGGYDETMRSGNEDWDLWIRLMAAGYTSVQVRAPLFRYRKHGVSMSVETESRYEDVLADMTARHPELYDRAALAALKARAYPLLTVIHDGGAPSDDVARDDGVPLDDVDTVHLDGRPLGDVVRDVRSKYVTWLPRGSSVPASALMALCECLEAEPDAGVARTSDPAPVAVVRTWSVFDPAGPADVVAVGAAGTAPEAPGTTPDGIRPGAFPDPGWIVPDEIDGVPVLRQRPEEAGFLPEWVAS